MSDLPIIMTADGAVPTPPAVLLATLIANVSATNPGFTATLPLSLVEDVTSTQIGGLALVDQARVDAVNSFSPFGVNEFILAELGPMLGVPLGQATNTSVFVVFSDAGSPGFVISKGFVVSDGTYQYVVEDGGALDQSGNSLPLFCVATQPGSWAVPSGSVQQIVTSTPSTVHLTCNNPQAGIIATGPQDATEYRSSVLQAMSGVAVGLSTFLRRQLAPVPGVQPRLVSALQIANNGGFIIIAGGGDPYLTAFAIYVALGPGIPQLRGSTMNVVSITNANPGVVATDKNHGYATGQVCQINGATGMPGINGIPLVATVIDGKSFSINVNTTALGAYTGGGVLTPNLRNVLVTITDTPDSYVIPYVNPPQQTVAMTVTWNTSSPNFVSSAAIAQAVAPALAAYVNGISVGQPINVDVMVATFQKAIANILPIELLTRLVFAVSINGVGTAPSAGTVTILGDPEGYFTATTAAINVVQG